MNKLPLARIDQLTGLRFFAALLVFLSHMKWQDVGQVCQRIFDQGYVGVSFFFVLSGFVLSYSYSEKLRSGSISKKKYVLLRFARLTPLHFLTAFPFIVLALKVGFFKPAMILLNLLFLQSWVPSSSYYFSLNAPSWSLSNEMFFYISFCGLVFLGERQRILMALSLAITVMVSAFVVEDFYKGDRFFGGNTFSHWLFYIFPGFRLLEFLAGMIVFDAWKRGALKNVSMGWLSIPFLLLAMLFGEQVPESFRWSLYYLPFVIFLLVGHLGDKKNLSGRFFSLKGMLVLGEASFAFYLIHQPIITWSVKLFPGLVEKQILFFAAVLMLAGALAILLMYVYERPAERYLKGKVLYSK